jgi:hypothetical protein
MSLEGTRLYIVNAMFLKKCKPPIHTGEEKKKKKIFLCNGFIILLLKFFKIVFLELEIGII